MLKKIFIINGSGGVGKDEFVRQVSKYVLTKNYSSVEKVKKIARLIGWNGRKTEKDRKFLSDLKVLCSEYSDMPFSDMSKTVADFQKGNEKFLFLHIREPEEIKRAKKEFGATTVLVKRDSVPEITSNMADRRVYDYDYDIIINNSGTIEELSKIAHDFVMANAEE